MLFAPDYAPTLQSFGWHVQAPEQPGRVRLVDAPSGGPERAIRCELQPGDNNPIGNTSRAEVYALHGQYSTTPAEQWPLAPNGTYRFSLIYYLQSPWPTVTDSTWLTLTQIKGLKGGSPPVAVEAYKSRLRVKVTGKDWDLGTLPVDAWTRIDLLIHLSTDGSDSPETSGWFEVSRDGAVKVPRTLRRTMDTYTKNGVVLPDPGYLKQGLYRSLKWNELGATHVAFFGPPVIDLL